MGLQLLGNLLQKTWYLLYDFDVYIIIKYCYPYHINIAEMQGV